MVAQSTGGRSGRRPTGRALSNTERQQRFREKQREKQLEAIAAWWAARAAEWAPLMGGSGRRRAAGQSRPKSALEAGDFRVRAESHLRGPIVAWPECPLSVPLLVEYSLRPRDGCITAAA